MSTKTVHFDNAEYLLSKFKTMEDVKKYEEEQMERVIKHNSQISERNKRNKERRDKIYRQFS